MMIYTKRNLAAVVLLGIGLILLLLVACDDPGGLQPPVVQRAMDMSLSRSDWEPASFPVQLGDRFERAKLLWHNAREIEIPPVYRRHPSWSIPFRLILRPSQDGTLYDETIVTSDSLGRKWNGLMTRLSDEIKWDQVDYLYVIGRTNGAVLHIDLGRISEDRNGNGINDTEDKDGNFYVSEDEDTGSGRCSRHSRTGLRSGNESRSASR